MILEILSWVCLMLGAVLGIIGGIGMHRFPDFYSRLHAAGTTDTLCAALFLLGLSFQAGLTLASFKLLPSFNPQMVFSCGFKTSFERYFDIFGISDICVER